MKPLRDLIEFLQFLQAQGWDGEGTWVADTNQEAEPMVMRIDNRITLRKEQGK